jgi:hypothetical protein
VGLGVVLLYDKSYTYLFTLLNMHSDKYPKECIDYAAYASIGIGGLILFVGFFGCCGALQESKCMIGTVRIDIIHNYILLVTTLKDLDVLD